ncbi:hypothetical protein K491DRAFT_215804 [Lophiostoma macrostomum CBS 122681]|uniref:Uncharacterized protein n=1 Tax=Lophiostoma macrostomum CBS 122681 TaxID=1314788 RepID=A0A6A6TGR8_9PLEO|nr:hypothetical protein K491DRAFT_215804 [Lophiostoma macrostomum CBS 122681]
MYHTALSLAASFGVTEPDELSYEEDPVQITIALPIDQYDSFLLSGEYQNDLPSQQLNHQLGLACTLVHEIAHACALLWGKTQKDSHPKYKEPYIHKDDLIPEAGYSWERSIFGGFAPLVEDHVMSFIPDVVAKSANVTYRALIDIQLPADYTAQFFRKKTWADSRTLRDRFNLVTSDRPATYFRVGVFDDGRLKVVTFNRGRDEYEDLRTRSIDWPESFKAVIAKYREMCHRELAAALEMGLDVSEYFVS